jgi:hypothetical protein
MQLMRGGRGGGGDEEEVSGALEVSNGSANRSQSIGSS